jgi:uncharacterized membrane protein (DUF106 family)
MFEQLLTVFDFIFSPFFVFSPVVSLVLVATTLTVIVMAANMLAVNRKAVKEIKDRMEQIRENLTKAQKEGNKEETNKFLSEMMSINSEYMRQTFRAMIISIVIISIFLPWLKYKYDGKFTASLPFNAPIVGSSIGWLLWYFIVSFTVGWIIKKVLGIDYA